MCNTAGKDPTTCAHLVDALVGHLIEPACVQPTFLCDHPTIMSPLARQHPSLPGQTERFELLIAGREFCNAYNGLQTIQISSTIRAFTNV